MSDHKTFHVGVKAIIKNRDKVLVLKEEDINDHKRLLFDFPGGRIEDDETIEDAFKRELKEELGITNFSLGDIIYAQRHSFYNKNGSSLIHVYYRVFIEDFNFKLSEEHTSFEWISKDQLSKLDNSKVIMPKAIKTILAKVLE